MAEPPPPPRGARDRLVPIGSAGARLSPSPVQAGGRGDATTAWCNGYVWLRLGRHDLAHAWWDLVEDARIMPRVHVSRGASLRELGLHARSEHEDRSGLSLAETGPTERAALSVGLVADAVGQGDVDGAVLRLHDAQEAVAALRPGRDRDRQRIRLGWVEVEAALVAGRAATASSLPQLGSDGTVSAPRHYRAGTDHHLAKGLLFAGVVTREMEPLDRASVLAPPGLAWAVHLARADLGAAGAMARARAAWSRIVPPAHLLGEVVGAPEVAES